MGCTTEGANMPANGATSAHKPSVKHESPTRDLGLNGLALEEHVQPDSRPSFYGKWRYVRVAEQRMAFESDILALDSKRTRLVDLPANKNDVQLWLCILDYRHEKHGLAGIVAVFEGVKQRRTLYDVQGEAAKLFWQTILDAALSMETMLEGVMVYAEWLHDQHGVCWPNLYSTIVSYFLSTGQRRQTMQWHLRLSPCFGANPTEFAQTMKIFLADPSRQRLLRGLYITSLHRNLYDEIVPYLYAQGRLRLAHNWRVFLQLNNDIPKSDASRPYLRFVAGYYPNITLANNELAAAGLHQAVSAGGTSKAWKPRLLSAYDENGKLEPKATNLHYIVNKVHGETFGIKEKEYNDKLGARWFASSWVSLDFAIDTVRLLGFTRIGPLSLQSIALREEGADVVLQRIEQLEASGIAIGNSSYAQALRRFASVGDQELLTSLLHSDIHPDVFDDVSASGPILRSALARKDWKQYQLILAVRLGVSMELSAVSSNTLLLCCLGIDHGQMVLQILNDMVSRGIQLFPSTSVAISAHIFNKLSMRTEHGKDDVQLHAAILRQAMTMQFPVATQAIWITLLRLGREGHYPELQGLLIDFANRYHEAHDHSPGRWWFINNLDLPDVVRHDAKDSNFSRVPQELGVQHPLHPLNLLFDRKLTACLIRWGFKQGCPGPRPIDQIDRANPEHFSFARSIRLLSLLREKGLFVDKHKLIKLVMMRLAEMHMAGRLHDGRQQSSAFSSHSRLGLMSLKDAKHLCDEAWGSEFLPALPELRRWTEGWERSWWAKKKMLAKKKCIEWAKAKHRRHLIVLQNRHLKRVGEPRIPHFARFSIPPRNVQEGRAEILLKKKLLRKDQERQKVRSSQDDPFGALDEICREKGPIKVVTRRGDDPFKPIETQVAA
ncbi:hypothetical protein B0H63DRAFT_454383 [Podospora didyma]|uniref:Uncharacterized protein n=1 Tax=Podospora didyma TaxID=330526 RepID=A0AAE0K4Y9_9PEZI|nr:hypothetical protein B0H63DRAFT_454383 [Podospora didyma]